MRVLAIIIIFICSFSLAYAACDGCTDGVGTLQYDPTGVVGSGGFTIGGAGGSCHHGATGGAFCDYTANRAINWNPTCAHYGQYYFDFTLNTHAGAGGAGYNVVHCQGDDCVLCCSESPGGILWTGDGGASNCCGDDAGETYCSGGYTACVNAGWYTDGDANAATCECGGTGTGVCNVNGEQGCWLGGAGFIGQQQCCGDDGAVDRYCVSATPPFQGCDNAVFYNDGDSSQYVCETCGSSFWFNDGGQDNCCEDDATEFMIEEFDSLSSSTCPECLYDGVNSQGCCNAISDCVDDGVCYNDHTFGPAPWRRNIGEPGDYNDEEICHDTGWHDPDDSPYYCGVAGFTWLRTGMKTPHTQYTGYLAYDCCGDDDNEHVISSELDEPGGNLCCNETDCLMYNGSTYPDPLVRSWVAGTVRGEDPDNIGTYIPLANANVTVMNADGTIGNSNLTGINGRFNISIHAWFASTVNIFRQHYETGVFAVVPDSDQIYNLNFQYSCDAQCKSTSIPNSEGLSLCDQACDGIFTCSFPTDINPSGETAGQVCHGSVVGHRKPWNITHDVVCCNFGFLNKNATTGTTADFVALDTVVDIDQRSVMVVVDKNGKTLTVELVEYNLVD